MKKNSVSVIIPCWNNESTIKMAINSALNQTLLPEEILVCDDGSTDKTEKAVKTFHSPLVKWLDTKKHSGRPAVPRNRGLKKAKGEWLAFLDADDTWLPDKLKEQIVAAEETRCLAVCSNAYRQKSISISQKSAFT
jgi:teichuronic acid biosynthesis glycosyltransferase TuaG